MMKYLKPLLPTLATGALLFTGIAFAQDAPPPPPAPMPAPTAPAEPMAPPAPPAPTPNASPSNMATMQTPQGQVTVHSAPAPAPVIGPAPAFEQLSGGGKSISETQASAYPPLANDFINADTNRNGSISKSEYEHWIKQL